MIELRIFTASMGFLLSGIYLLRVGLDWSKIHRYSLISHALSRFYLGLVLLLPDPGGMGLLFAVSLMLLSELYAWVLELPTLYPHPVGRSH